MWALSYLNAKHRPDFELKKVSHISKSRASYGVTIVSNVENTTGSV